jgi:capsular exopolysaccharide synthesis family protein
MDVLGGDLHVRELWNVLVHRRWVVVLGLTAATLVALTWSFLATPAYRARTVLIIERQEPDILTFRDLARADFAVAAHGQYYQTQYRVIASPAVARLAVEQLGLVHHPSFDRGADGGPGWLRRLLALVPQKGRRGSVSPEDAATSAILAGLEVAPVRNSQLVEIAWVGPDPEVASNVVNAVADAYIHFNLESRYTTTDQARNFLLTQTETLKTEIEQIERELQRYGQDKRIVSIDESNNVTLQALSDVSARWIEARAELARAEAAWDSARTRDAATVAEIDQSELITRLRQEHATYEAEYTEKRQRFGDAWPAVATLRSRLAQARARLDAEIERIAVQVRASAENDWQRARREVDNLEALRDDSERAAQRLKADAVEYVTLQSEVDKKRETLDALIRRQNEMALSTRLKDLDTTTSNVRVLERSTPPVVPFRPNLRANLLLGVFGGLLLGIGLAFALDQIDNSVASRSELERVTAMPVMAVVPRYRGASPARTRSTRAARRTGPFDFVAHDDRRSVVTEAYRDLRTAILLSSAGHPPRRIMVTSALPEEGKTATATNLAIVLAQLERRVLLVDTDLRLPRIHDAFGVPNAHGISTYLSGLERDPGRLVVSTRIANLDLLPAGPVPPNPLELLNSEIFANLAGMLERLGYDHVVFDSPPAVSVSDPVLIATVADVCLLIVRSGRASRPSVKLAAERLRAVEGPSFGTVLNDVDPKAPGSMPARYYGRYAEVDEPRTDAADDRVAGSA